MEEIIKILLQIDNREIPVLNTVSPYLIDIIKKYKDEPINKNVVRNYLITNDLYGGEEDLEYFMRDLFTTYAQINDNSKKVYFENLIKKFREEDDNKITLLIKQIINNGLKCYPVSYIDDSVILGVITQNGHVII